MITRQEVRRFLGDRQWHTGLELLEYFRDQIPPEQASEAFYAARKRARSENTSEIPMDAVVSKGRELVLAVIVSTLKDAGLVEVSGGRAITERRIRWTAWYCWLCGFHVKGSGEISDSGLCPECDDSLACDEGIKQPQE